MTPRQWGTRGALSLIDQGLLSGSNFLISILYARWLVPDRYGEFAIMLAAFLFLAGFHNALLIEPMTVLAPARNDFAQPGYMASLLTLHAVVTVPVGLVLVLAGFLIRAKGLPFGAGVLGLGLAFPVILLFWLLRRSCYLEARPDQAALGSLSYAATSILVLAMTQNWASPFAGLAAMAAGSVVASAILLNRKCLAGGASGWRTLLAQHWTYGRWVVGTAFLYWTTGTFFTPIVGATVGLTKAAVFRSSENFLLPIGQIVTAGTLFVLPWASRETYRRGTHWLWRITWKTSAGGFLLAAIYSVGLLAAGPRLFRWVYSNQAYEGSVGVLAILCVAAVIRSTADFGVSLSLRAAARSSPMLWATLAASVVSLTAGIWLIDQKGVIGAAWATLLASAVQATVLLWHFALLGHAKESGLVMAAQPAIAEGLGDV